MTNSNEQLCAYCDANIEEHDTVPSVSDDDTWADLAEEHGRDCEWVATRAHRLEGV